jgi:hypothetical protein
VDVAEVGRQLRRQFSDLRNHFVFEYYPWYGTNPWRHWEGSGRTPPYDIAATAVPELGPYDSGNPRVLEQHARWITESGAGAINVSWWGRDSYEDRLVPLLMDVMRDHDLKVTFHLEPYGDNRVDSYASDIQYLVTEYGDKRHWDCQLVLRNAAGEEGPVFKAFATIQPRVSTDCHGRSAAVAMWRPDDVWHLQIDTVREMLRRHFDNVWQLSDFPVADPVLATGFDGARTARFPQTASARARSAAQPDVLAQHWHGLRCHRRAECPRGLLSAASILPPADINWSSAADRGRPLIWPFDKSKVDADVTCRADRFGVAERQDRLLHRLHRDVQRVA